ncbi:unnamed protein product [Symbiodinium natans]|uniref:Uncharacterized protein n=1 Tax=Symbiodinium natans TaxID=878477 RepID=A0A812Q6U2_9DINO|nr:unnamed protein product [Symbiodinium natans]
MMCGGLQPPPGFSSQANDSDLKDLGSTLVPMQQTRSFDWALCWDPCGLATECAIEGLLDQLQEAQLSPFALFCIKMSSWEEGSELKALKVVFGMAKQLHETIPPLPFKLGVRKPSDLGAIGSQGPNVPLKIPLPVGIDRSSPADYEDFRDLVDLVDGKCKDYVGRVCQAEPMDHLRMDFTEYIDYGDFVRSISFDIPDAPLSGCGSYGAGSCSGAPHQHRFHARGKAEIFAEDRRSFLKKQKGRLSLVSEDRVHKQGVERYQVSFLSGELSRADGVGIIFSQSLPKTSDIQQIVSLFLNRTGRLCSRVNQRVTRIASTLPQIELGDVIEVENDIDMRCARFTIWSARGADPSTATVSYGQVADQLTSVQGQPIPGHLAVVVKHPGVSVSFLS